MEEVIKWMKWPECKDHLTIGNEYLVQCPPESLIEGCRLVFSAIYGGFGELESIIIYVAEMPKGVS